MATTNPYLAMECRDLPSGQTGLSTGELDAFLEQHTDWQIQDQGLEKTFKLDSYLGGVDFAQNVAEMAEGQNHHPTISIFYGKVRVHWTTHSTQGISINDLIASAKTEEIYKLHHL